MDIPSLSDRPVGSRFVSQDEIDLAKQRREEQWKAAYARLGQEPPPPQQEDVYDGRSLAEVGSSSLSTFSPYSHPLLVFHVSRNLLRIGYVVFLCTHHITLTPCTDSEARGMGRKKQTRSLLSSPSA